MTEKFIQAWCEEHGFSNKVGAIILFENLTEKDLFEDDFYENDELIDGLNGSYRVYSDIDIDRLIDEHEEDIQDSLSYKISPNELKDYINWNKYFDDHPIEIEDLFMDEEYTVVDFYRDTYYILKSND